MKEEQIFSFEQLASIAYRSRTEHWIFRGVRSDEYKLIPKIGRDDYRKRQESNDIRPFDVHYERYLLDIFRRKARPLIKFEVNRLIDWMAIGQHHGLPTRLLDWTESLFVAAYFATNDTIENTRATIYAIRNISVLPQCADPFDIETDMRFDPTPFSPRITAQRSVFTIHRLPTEPFDHPELHKYIFAGKEPEHRRLAYRVKLALDSLGFNSATMMPDLDGLAAHLGWSFKRERLPPRA